MKPLRVRAFLRAITPTTPKIDLPQNTVGLIEFQFLSVEVSQEEILNLLNRVGDEFLFVEVEDSNPTDKGE